VTQSKKRLPTLLQWTTTVIQIVLVQWPGILYKNFCKEMKGNTNTCGNKSKDVQKISKNLRRPLIQRLPVIQIACGLFLLISPFISFLFLQTIQKTINC